MWWLNFSLTGGNSIDIHSWHRLGMWADRDRRLHRRALPRYPGDVMSDDTDDLSTMINGYRGRQSFPKPHDRSPRGMPQHL